MKVVTSYVKKLEWSKVSNCSIISCERMTFPRTIRVQPRARPVMTADMPSPMYFELQQWHKEGGQGNNYRKLLRKIFRKSRAVAANDCAVC